MNKMKEVALIDFMWVTYHDSMRVQEELDERRGRVLLRVFHSPLCLGRVHLPVLSPPNLLLVGVALTLG
jgi:hypothetical protein